MSRLDRHPHPARRRRVLSPLPAVLVVLLGAATAVGATPVPSGAAHTGTASGTTASQITASQIAVASADDDDTVDDTPEPSLTITVDDHGVVESGAELTATIALDNPGGGDPPTGGETVPIPTGSVVVQRGAAPLSDRDALDDWLRGAIDPDVTAFGEVTTEEVSVGGTASIELVAAAPTTPGVYPILAQFVPDETTEQDDTPADAYDATPLVDSGVIVVTGDSDPNVTLVMPITAPATSRGLLTSDQLAILTAPDGALTAQLDAVDRTPTALAIDPAIPAAIRVLGASAPSSAVAWLDRLDSLPNDRFALQFGDADVATQVAAGQTPLLEPTSLAPYFGGATEPDDEDDAEEAEPTPTSASNGVADPATLTMDELLDIGAATPNLFWPDPDAVTGATIAYLTEENGTALVPSLATAEGEDGSAVPARGEGVLVYDSAVSTAMSSASAMGDSDERHRAIAAATASLWLASDETDGEPVLVALDRIGGVDTANDTFDRQPDARHAVADVVSAVTAFSARSLTSLTSRDARPVTVLTGEEPARTGIIDELRTVEERLTDVGSVLSDPLLLTGRTRAEELQLLGVSWSRHPDAWELAIESHRESVRGLENAVGIVPPSDVRLLSSEAPLPVWIRNDLPYPVTVTLYSRPDDVRLEVQLVTEVEAQPSSNTRVQVPVEASIGSGELSIRLELESPTGVEIGSAETMNVSVRADWERFGLAGLAVLIVGLLAFGTFRMIRGRRRAKAQDASAAGGSPDVLGTEATANDAAPDEPDTDPEEEGSHGAPR